MEIVSASILVNDYQSELFPIQWSSSHLISSYIFILAVEMFDMHTRNVYDSKQIKDPSDGNLACMTKVLNFAEVLLFRKADQKSVVNLKHALYVVGRISGFKINDRKSLVIPVNFLILMRNNGQIC